MGCLSQAQRLGNTRGHLRQGRPGPFAQLPCHAQLRQAFLTRLLVTLASEQMIAWAFFKVAEGVVKSTKTTKDDEWLEKVREVYQSK